MTLEEAIKKEEELVRINQESFNEYSNSIFTEYALSCKKCAENQIDLDMGRVKALRNAGWTIEKIADDLHVSSATISTRLKQEEGENAKLD